jgi:hypothetical protein
MTLKKFYKAEFICSSYSYNTTAYSKMSIKYGSEREHDVKDKKTQWFDHRILQYIPSSDQRIQLAPGLIHCGEMNILPTAAKPLTGFENYTGRASGIFPHAKICMTSIASAKFEPTKFNYTTGTITHINYIKKKAGLRAEHHHTYGALLVEVTHEGFWYVRQLNADRKGVIHDLDIKVEGGRITTGNRIEAINWGDIHHASIDPTVLSLGWTSAKSMINALKPKYQFYNDLLDFSSRNHHNKSNCHKMFELHISKTECVSSELKNVVKFLMQTKRKDCQSIVIDSNHDNALGRWLREADYRNDHINAIFFLTAQLRYYRSIKNKEPNFHLVEWALKELGCPEDIIFLQEDESFITCKDCSDGIENGMHGHLGLNGARGSPTGFSRMGRKANTAHTHSASIIDGVYTAGLSALMDQGYNKGPSSWSQSHILTYPNGKRAIITMFANRWRG